jgi:fermentation-respiration switch protein FrsA (DUF1100 family)
VFDLPRTMRAFRRTLDAMWEETARLNLFELAPALEVLVFFSLGCNDHGVPPEAGLAYFEALKAPKKELVWFERSGTSRSSTRRRSSTPPWPNSSCRWHVRTGPPARLEVEVRLQAAPHARQAREHAANDSRGSSAREPAPEAAAALLALATETCRCRLGRRRPGAATRHD